MDDSKNLPPTKEWWAWYLSPPVDYRKKYGDALEFSPYEKALMQQLKEKNNG